MSVQVRCTKCEQLFLIDDSADGHQLICPNCQADAQREVEPSTDASDSIVVAEVVQPEVVPVANFASFDGELGYYENSASPYTSTTQQATVKPQEVYPQREIQADVLQIGSVLTTAWDRTFTNLGVCLLAGLYWSVIAAALAGLGSFSFSYLQSQNTSVFGRLESTAQISLFTICFLAVCLPLISWIKCGALDFGLTLCRNQEVDLKRIFSGSSQWVLLLAISFVFVIAGSLVIGLWLLLGFPSPIAFLRQYHTINNLDFLLLVFKALILNFLLFSLALAIPYIIFSRFALAPFLIIERKMSFTESMTKSNELMAGNKFKLLLIAWVTLLIFVAISTLTVGLGFMLIFPFCINTASTVYLLITKQIMPVRGY